jgi:hypothetical protein
MAGDGSMADGEAAGALAVPGALVSGTADSERLSHPTPPIETSTSAPRRASTERLGITRS